MLWPDVRKGFGLKRCSLISFAVRSQERLLSIFMPVLKQNGIYAGRYLLIQLLGEGGFSEVWKAEDQMADNAVVAIKVYAPSKGLDDYGLRQFRNEFSLTQNFTHPNLLKVHHFDISEGSPYLIMPYCPYGSLSHLLQDKGVFSEKQLAQVMYQIGSALNEVHQQDPPIVHQDIKPDNILLLHPEYYLLADFGISSRIRHTLQKATSAMQSLTVAYAPPERFDRHPSTSTASDIFSLGVTLYEMCTNTVPWDGVGGQCLLKGASIPALPGNYSAELNTILEACMAHDPSERPTAAAIQAYGKRYLETGQWQLPGQQKAKRSLPKALTHSLMAAAVALLTLGGLWAFDTWYEGTPTAKATTEEGVAASPVEEPAPNPLEDQLKTMEAQLHESNQQLLLKDSIYQLMVQKSEREAERQPASASPEQQASQEQVKRTAPAAAGKEPTATLSLKVQKNLNKISDPAYSREARSGWKQETLAQFASGSVRILDESDGALTEYRAGIFLTLLLTSPHEVTVREVKTDKENKITELRLTKQAIRPGL